MRKRLREVFFGGYYNTIDAKGRVVIPAKFREALGEKIIILKGNDDCVNIYPESELENIIEQFKGQDLDNKQISYKVRNKLSYMQECQFDVQGRVTIQQPLRELIKLDKNVHIIGAYDHVELWDKDQFILYCEKHKDDET